MRGLAGPAAFLERIAQAFQQAFVVHRLFQEIEGPRAHRADGKSDFGMAGDQDQRRMGLALCQLALQLQPAHIRHAHVGDDAVAVHSAFQITYGGGIVGNMESSRFQQYPQGMTHGFMIVYDDDNRICVHGCSLQYRDVKKNQTSDAMAGEMLRLVSCGAGG